MFKAVACAASAASSERRAGQKNSVVPAVYRAA